MTSCELVGPNDWQSPWAEWTPEQQADLAIAELSAAVSEIEAQLAANETRPHLLANIDRLIEDARRLQNIAYHYASRENAA